MTERLSDWLDKYGPVLAVAAIIICAAFLGIGYHNYRARQDSKVDADVRAEMLRIDTEADQELHEARVEWMTERREQEESRLIELIDARIADANAMDEYQWRSHPEAQIKEPLMSLEEYECTRPKVETPFEARNGIACPKCGQELWDDLTTIITTYPAQYHIFCKNKDCGWTGTRH